MQIVLQQDCAEADEFLEILSPTGNIFGGAEAIGSQEHLGDAGVFRGHSDDGFSLVPTATRAGDAFARFSRIRCDDNDSQIREEISILRRFFNLADANGLVLPEDSQTLRRTIYKLSSNSYIESLDEGKEAWPPVEIWSLLAIAQHYGIPTRLLDWTRRAHVAAYFAASSATKRYHEGKNPERFAEKRLSVWAFAFDRFASYCDPEISAMFSEKTPPSLPVVKITAPRAGNQNLHAQSGLFSLQLEEFKGKIVEVVRRQSLETFVESFLKDHKMNNVATLFHRITLPWCRASHLLWLLQQWGIGRAVIYPGYGGVVGALEEESTNW
jgi:hypothetical protein